uniref:Uncharacterized protein n=1 Tax=Salix viminalis TaxID=40686 RepID=A0A6N2NDN7_SALVM
MLFLVGTEAYKNHFRLQGICRSVKKKKKNKSRTKVCSQNPTKPARFLCVHNVKLIGVYDGWHHMENIFFLE